VEHENPKLAHLVLSAEASGSTVKIQLSFSHSWEGEVFVVSNWDEVKCWREGEGEAESRL
jgi:hypothetical protein